MNKEGVNDLLARQAAAVKQNATNLKVAKLLEKRAQMDQQIAAMLRGEAGAEQSFKSQREAKVNAKEARLASFGAAVAQRDKMDTKAAQETAHAMLTRAGWSKRAGVSTDGKQVYAHPSKPGHRLVINGTTFTIQSAADILVGNRPLSELKNYLINQGNYQP